VRLVESSGIELFCDLQHNPYVALSRQGGREVLPLNSDEFRTHLSQLAFELSARVPSETALNDAIRVLKGMARSQGHRHPVYTRIGGDDHRIYLDLGDANWRAVEIDAEGWRLVSQPAIYFCRRKSMLALPEPVPGGNLDQLRPLLNLGEERHVRLVVAFLLAAFRPHGPYPLLLLAGEQGSAKSMTARILRGLIDPQHPPLRSMPQNEENLALAAQHSWILAFDNLSHLSRTMSDALCRLATGSGVGRRKLYTDSEESVFDAQRPAILTGISAHQLGQADLLDRALCVQMPPIPSSKRRTEAHIQAQVKEVAPAILGALLTAVSTGLKRLPTIHLPELPRMADLIVWVEACAPALGWSEGEFAKMFHDIQADQQAEVLSSWSVYPILYEGLRKLGTFRGTPNQLLEKLNNMRGNKGRPPEDWPKDARALAGQLRQYAPHLRQAGIHFEDLQKRQRDGYQILLCPVQNYSK
jgi:hypothetical protein